MVSSRLSFDLCTKANKLYKTVVTRQTRKLGSQTVLHIIGVAAPEIPIMRLMKVNPDGHDLTHLETSLSSPMDFTATKLLFPPVSFKSLAEVAD
jgi:hypothetical protein